MDHDRHDFSTIDRLEADAVGEPGRRTFRLLVAGPRGVASLWLEKEELQALGVATDQLLAQFSGRVELRHYGQVPVLPKPGGPFPSTPDVEFKVGQLSIGYETDTGLFVLLVHDAERDLEAPATFTCLATSAQMRSLGRSIEVVIAAGRPKCALCGDPIDPEGHLCVRLN